MKERPIIMSGPMVRAIIEGRKTQTRRIAKPEEFGSSSWAQLPEDLGRSWARNARPRHPRFGEAGDYLWVRETWQAWVQVDYENDEWEVAAKPNRSHAIEHKAASTSVGPWRPSIHMPRWASRITLQIAEVRVQRLQEISDEDVVSEGVSEEDARCDGECGATPCSLLVPAFRRLWNSLNAERAPWDSNPWVWAISFVRVP